MEKQLLDGAAIERVNQGWCSDITYIPMAKGFLFLVVVMGWVSRAVLAWLLIPGEVAGESGMMSPG